MRIRLATPSDLDVMIELIGLLFAIEPDNRFEPAKARRGLNLLLAHQDAAAVWVADQDGAVVGMCSAQIVISTAEGGPSAWIEDLVVAPARRGEGVGRQLLDAVATWAARRGLTRLQLLADQYNQAGLDFYKHLDWQGTRLICLRHYPGVTP